MKENKDFELFDRFMNILRVLSEYKVEYVLIGGLAVIIHGFPRLTSDIDLFVKMDGDNINRLKIALKKLFPLDQEIESISIKDLQEYAVVRFGTEEDFFIDIVGKIGEMFEYQDLEYEVKMINEIPVRLATPECLLRMKSGTVRPEDKRDAFFLSELITRIGKK